MAAVRGSWRAELGLLLASVSLATAGVEAVLRASGFDPRPPAPREVGVGGRLVLDCYPDDPLGQLPLDLRDEAARRAYERELGRGLGEVAARTPHAVESRYNSLGFRDREFGPRAAGTLRVIAVGDSFTEGEGVPAEATWPSRLQARLPAGYEVFNAGRRGDDIPDVEASVERILAHDPDVVVYAFVLNDAEQSPDLRARQRFVNDWILDRTAELRTGDAPSALRLVDWIDARLLARRVSAETTRWYLDMYGPANAEGWRRTQERLRRMDARVRGRGARFVLAVWPLLVGLPGDYPFHPVHAAIREACRGAGIEHVDLLDAMAGHDARALWVHPADLHPNALAQDLAARALSAALVAGRP